MKIALFGYGKMGQTIQKLAIQRQHEVVAIFEEGEKEYQFKNADVAIDFSTPDSAYKNIALAIDHQIPIISGTTGWMDDFDKAENYCYQKKGAFLYASNFSLGVNLFFELNSRLAKLMDPFEYDISLEETHHTEKIDAPSGTAINLAEDIIRRTKKDNWVLGVTNQAKTIPIESKRIGTIPGTHCIKYDSAVDEITITHRAKNRMGFALGAIIAAEWIQHKQGVFGMKDVLGI